MNFNKLLEDYQKYREPSFATRRFKHKDILPLVESLKVNKLFNITKLGYSVEKREIFSIKIGTGKTKILLWSQMHGDEPTATMVMFDIFNFFCYNDGLNNFKKTILDNLTLYFIPMLNPDGAENFSRTNSLGIDLNRDAAKVVSPESKILKKIVEDLKPTFAFNLHDQDLRWSVGGGKNPSTISLLAPVFNQKKDMNEIRENAMKVIVGIHNNLTKFIPGCIARYDDEFGPRSFGDNITKWGVSAILFEAGKMANDPEKEYIRNLHFASLLHSFYSIATEKYKSADIGVYNNIPVNGKLLYDVIFRSLNRKIGKVNYNLDVAINVEGLYDQISGEQYFIGTIEEIGDLSNSFGYKEIDCRGMSIHEGKLYNEKLSKGELHFGGISKYLNKGYTHCSAASSNKIFTKLPINIVTVKKNFENKIDVNCHANFFIKENNSIKYTIVNGFIHKYSSNQNSIKNGLIY
jgi:hypothetical protein